MAYETVIYEKKQDGVAVINFNRPEKRNALNRQLTREFRQALGEAEEDGEVKVIIITGNPECFSAGADLTEIVAAEKGIPESSGPSVIEAVRECEKPTIAAVSGYCIAGGLEVALVCDIIIASETARIGDGHIRMGLLGGGGSTTRLPRAIGQRKAKELILTGDTISGNEAYNVGLVNHVYPKDKYLDEAMALAKKMASWSILAIKLSKKAVEAAADMDEFQSFRYTWVLTRELNASEEYKERIGAFLKK